MPWCFGPGSHSHGVATGAWGQTPDRVIGVRPACATSHDRGRDFGLALAITFTISGLRPVAAQIDYRNLDADRPVRTEDAYPIERFAFELVLPYAYEHGRAGEHLHLFTPELGYGVLSNTQVGLELPLAALDERSGTDWGFAGPRMFALYNLNTEGRKLPAIALRADVALPFGDLGADDVQLTAKGIATRSWGLTRLHLNVAVTLGREVGRPTVGAEPEWALSLAADRTVLRQSLLLVGEVGVLEETSDAPTVVLPMSIAPHAGGFRSA